MEKKGKMDKKLVFFLLIMVVLAAGCQQKDSGGGEKSRSGTKGLEISFVSGSPPAKFLSEGTINIAIQLKNGGWETVNAGNVYISGYDTSIVKSMKNPRGEQIPRDGIGQLGGKNSFDPQGEFEIKEFKADVSLGQNVDVYRPTFLVTACYDYKTLATPVICIDPDPFGITTKEKVCTTKDVSLSGGQGAPVAIQRVEVSPTSEKVRFNIQIANVGGGDVYEQSNQKCDPYHPDGLSFNDLDLVTLEEVKIANIPLTQTCKPLTNGKIKLINGRRNVFCELDLASTGLAKKPGFSTPLTIKLGYGYRDSISKSVGITKIPK